MMLAPRADIPALHPPDLSLHVLFGLGLMECRVVTTSAISKGHAASCPAELFLFQVDVSPGLVMVVTMNPNATLRHSGPPAGFKPNLPVCNCRVYTRYPLTNVARNRAMLPTLRETDLCFGSRWRLTLLRNLAGISGQHDQKIKVDALTWTDTTGHV